MGGEATTVFEGESEEGTGGIGVRRPVSKVDEGAIMGEKIVWIEWKLGEREMVAKQKATINLRESKQRNQNKTNQNKTNQNEIETDDASENKIKITRLRYI